MKTLNKRVKSCFYLNGASELGIGDEERVLGILGDLLEDLLQRLGDLAFDRARYGRQRNRGVIELLKVLELQTLLEN